MRFNREAQHVAEEAFTPGKSKGTFEDIRVAKNSYYRAVAILSFLASHMPDAVREEIQKILECGYDFNKWPFNLKEYESIERMKKGYRSEVFLLDPKEDEKETYVVKVGFRSAGKEMEEIFAEAKRYTAEYEAVSDWYASIPGLVPWEASFISSDPRNGERAVFTIQHFLGKNVRDVFEDFREDELAELLRKETIAREALLEFVKITREGVDTFGRIVDIGGECNLLFSSSPENETQLHFVDTHDVLRERVDRRFPNRLEQLEYLEKVLARV